MRAKTAKMGVGGMLGALLIFLGLGGCGFLHMVTPEKTKNYNISGAGFDEAYTKAVRAAMEIGFDIYGSDKSAGVFTAGRMVGWGFGEITDMNFLLEKSSGGRLSFVIRVVSSKTEKDVINEFLVAYSKYVAVDYKGSKK